MDFVNLNKLEAKRSFSNIFVIDKILSKHLIANKSWVLPHALQFNFLKHLKLLQFAEKILRLSLLFHSTVSSCIGLASICSTYFAVYFSLWLRTSFTLSRSLHRASSVCCKISFAVSRWVGRGDITSTISSYRYFEIRICFKCYVLFDWNGYQSICISRCIYTSYLSIATALLCNIL